MDPLQEKTLELQRKVFDEELAYIRVFIKSMDTAQLVACSILATRIVDLTDHPTEWELVAWGDQRAYRETDRRYRNSFARSMMRICLDEAAARSK